MINSETPSPFCKKTVRIGSVLAFAAIVLIALFLARNADRSTWHEDTGKIFGTAYHIKYMGKYDVHNLISLELEKVDNTFSIFNPQSLVSRINAGQTDSVNSLFREVFLMCEEVHGATLGAFDPTVRPAVEAWGFGKAAPPAIPPEKIDSLRQLIGLRKVSLEGSVLRRPHGVTLDFGAIAKGYAVDRVARILEKTGVRRYIVEIGGEVRALGLNPQGDPWQVGIVSPPSDGGILATDMQDEMLQITQGSVATSGNYNNIRHIGGKRYSHTIDPVTASPHLSDILSATVIAPQCAVADAYATAFMVMGRDKTLKFLSGKDTTQLKAILY